MGKRKISNHSSNQRVPKKVILTDFNCVSMHEGINYVHYITFQKVNYANFMVCPYLSSPANVIVLLIWHIKHYQHLKIQRLFLK